MPSSKGWVLFKMHRGTTVHFHTGIVRKTGNLGVHKVGSMVPGPRKAQGHEEQGNQEMADLTVKHSLIINTSSFLSSANLNLHNSKFPF